MSENTFVGLQEVDSYRGKNMKREIKVLTDSERRKLDGTNISLHVRLNNPHKDMFVVKVLPGTKVFGYLDAAILEDCTMHIHHSARRKVADGANRSVHAWIRGTFRYISDNPFPILKGEHYSNELHYNPTKGDKGFMLHARLIKDRPTEPITTAERIIFWHKQIFLLKSEQVADFFERRGEL